MNGVFSARRDINHFELDDEKKYDRREVNAGLFHEWRALRNVGYLRSGR